MRHLLTVGMLAALAACGGSSDPDYEPATALRFELEPSDTASTDVVLTRQPVLQLVDASGNDTRGSVTVTASVIAGSGTVIAGGTATTDANGTATFQGLRLGAKNGTPGPVLLEFAAPGLEPVHAPVDVTCSVLPLSVGEIAHGSLAAHDCSFGSGPYFDQFALSLSPQVTPIRATMDASFRSAIYFQGPNEPLFFWGQAAAASATSTSLIVLAPPGKTIFAANSDAVGVTGQYSLSLEFVMTELGCEFPWIASPIASSFYSLRTGDCENGGFLEDYYVIGLPIGATIAVTATASEFTPYVDLWDGGGDGQQVAQDSGELTASLSYANFTGLDQVYLLRVTSNEAGESGSYGFSASVSYPGALTATAPDVTRRARSESTVRAPVLPRTRGRGVLTRVRQAP